MGDCLVERRLESVRCFCIRCLVWNSALMLSRVRCAFVVFFLGFVAWSLCFECPFGSSSLESLLPSSEDDSPELESTLIGLS